MDIDIVKHKQKISNLYKKVSDIDDEELKSHWAKYLCVLTSGLLENSFRVIISEYAKNKSCPNIYSYITNDMKDLTNLKDEKIKKLLSLFCNEWINKYESIVTDEQKIAIDSVVANRHLIAHGKDVGLSFVTMDKYYKSIAKVIDVLNQIINNENPS